MKRYYLFVCNCGDGPHVDSDESVDGDWVAANDALVLEEQLASATAERDALSAAAGTFAAIIRKNEKQIAESLGRSWFVEELSALEAAIANVKKGGTSRALDQDRDQKG